MSETQNVLTQDSSEFYQLKIPQDLNNILISITRVRTQRQLEDRLLKVENHEYWNELKNMFSWFIWKNVKVEHPEIWENVKQWKIIVLDENGEKEEKVNYVCSGYLVWNLKEIKFYSNSLWSLVLEKPDWWKSIVSMSELNDGIKINELTDKEFKKHKRIVKLTQDVSNKIKENISGTYSQY